MSFENFAPEAEALVKIDEWGGIIVPCDIVEVYGPNGTPIQDVSEIDENSVADVKVYVGSKEELSYRSEDFGFIVSVTKLSV